MRLLSPKAVRSLFLAGIAAAAAAGCTDFSTTPVSLGRVTVAVTDQNNAGVSLVPVDLLLLDRVTVWRALRTTTDGTGEFGTADGGVKSQMYVVRVIPPVGYRLDATDTNDKPVTVVIGQTHHVTFKLLKESGGPGGPG
jgi:hypothetical protein